MSQDYDVKKEARKHYCLGINIALCTICRRFLLYNVIGYVSF